MQMAAHQERTGRRIAEARARAGLTQEEAAHGAGVTHRAYQRWESGDVSPYPRNLEKLAAVFGVEAESLQVDRQAPMDDADQLDRIETLLRALAVAAGLDAEQILAEAALRAGAQATPGSQGSSAPTRRAS